MLTITTNEASMADKSYLSSTTGAINEAGKTPMPVVGPLVSILVPCCGMLEYTKLLIPSLLKHTRPPYDLIFIDIGSLDGTAEYLAGVATIHPTIRIEVVRTPTDLGIKDACREAIGKARGE